MNRKMNTRSSPAVEPVHILSVSQAIRNSRTLFEEHNSSFVEQRSSPQNEASEEDIERTVIIPNKEDLERCTNNQTIEDQLNSNSCPACHVYVSEGIQCSSCLIWYHQSCASLTDREYDHLSKSEDPWNCHHCTFVNSQDPVTTDGSFQPKIKCISCKRKVYTDEFIRCSGKCGKEFHGECVLSEDEKNKFFVIKSDDPWHCAECASFLQGSIKWGNMVGSDEISQQLDSMCNEMVCWKLNLFEVPRGKAGKDFINELERLLSELTYKTNWKSLSLKLIHVFMPSMLQRPTPRSKPQQNSKYLKERLTDATLPSDPETT